MKKSEIKVGVWYAYQTSKYGKPVPVLVVDQTAKGHGWWAQSPTSISGDITVFDGKPKYLPTPERYRHLTAKALMVTARAPGKRNHWDRPEPADFTPEHLRAVKAAATIETITSMVYTIEERERPSLSSHEQRRMAKYASFPTHPLFTPDLIDSYRGFIGEWDDVVQARDDEAQRRALVEAEAKAAAEARIAESAARVSALRAVGIDAPEAQEKRTGSYGWRGNTGTVVLTLAQVDALLSLIPDGARYVPPADTNVGDDGWSYAHPDGTTT